MARKRPNTGGPSPRPLCGTFGSPLGRCPFLSAPPPCPDRTPGRSRPTAPNTNTNQARKHYTKHLHNTMKSGTRATHQESGPRCKREGQSPGPRKAQWAPTPKTGGSCRRPLVDAHRSSNYTSHELATPQVLRVERSCIRKGALSKHTEFFLGIYETLIEHDSKLSQFGLDRAMFEAPFLVGAYLFAIRRSGRHSKGPPLGKETRIMFTQEV